MSVAQSLKRSLGAGEEGMTVHVALRVIGLTAFVSFVLFWTLVPLYWTVVTSVKPLGQVMTYPPVLFPAHPTLDGYLKLFGQNSSMQFSGVDGFQAFISSIFVSVASTAIALVLGVPAGYAYARNPGKIGGRNTAFWILSIRMFPPIAPILPLFFIFQKVGLMGTRVALVLLYLTFNVPLVVWLMRSFFRDIPETLEEAAMMDGHSRFKAFYEVTLPLALPGIVATGLLAWVFAWNEFQFALVFTRGASQTYPVMFPALESAAETLWNQMAALATVAMIPVILISVFMQKRLVRGLTLGAVKGQ